MKSWPCTTRRTTAKTKSSFVGLLALLCVVLLLPTPTQAKAVVLDDGNFEHQTQASTGQTTGKWFVMFYASWCGHCNRLKPIWDDMADELAQDEDVSGILVAQVDAVKNKLTASRFSIRSFPTLLYFAERKMYKYEGPRQAEDLKAFAISGYQEATPLDKIPPPPGFMEMQRHKLSELVSSNDQLSMLVEDFEHIIDMRKNAAAVLVVMGAILGFLLGCIFGCATRSSSSEPKTKEKQKAE